ncbi:hypothetical protein [Limnohabitans sp.]|uniref:hypothetical protein n=1 Tax=Limnohabitans sp. TaxID=1907725 RepID=UPI00286ECF5C|nr:hypothetical protein [Limnohabitans sp.]
MSSLITACPTLCNPEAFHTVPELRTELHRANGKLLEAYERIHGMLTTHHAALEWCTLVAAHHEEGNAEQVKAMLDNVIANKNRQQKTKH